MVSDAPDLSADRAAVLAAMAAVPASLRPPMITAPGPLTSLPAPIEAKLAARAAAGYDPVGADHPRGRVWQQVVLPTGVLAVLDAGGSGILLVADHPGYALVGAAVFVPLAGGSLVARRYAVRDPLRLSARELRVITQAARWESAQMWTGELSRCDERALVVVAAATAARITGTAEWRSGDHHARLDLAAELTQIDEQAHRAALVRHGPLAGTSSATGLGAAWHALVQRVAALHAYADALDGADRAAEQRRAALGDPPVEAALAAGSARDDLAAEHLRSLTDYLEQPPVRGFTVE